MLLKLESGVNMTDKCQGEAGKIEGKLSASYATDNHKLHQEAMLELLTGADHNKKLPQQVKECNTQRAKADSNHPWLQTLTIQ